eukprot:XP_001709348.1 Hypothetical protein GL50803_35894 [Giardia lamblia ATCC 50803]
MAREHSRQVFETTCFFHHDLLKGIDNFVCDDSYKFG